MLRDYQGRKFYEMLVVSLEDIPLVQIPRNTSSHNNRQIKYRQVILKELSVYAQGDIYIPPRSSSSENSCPGSRARLIPSRADDAYDLYLDTKRDTSLSDYSG